MQKPETFEVLPPGDPSTDIVRTTFRTRMQKLYTGWDDTFDRRFDEHSFLFLLRDNHRNFLATCRLVFKQQGEKRYLTPMEMGDTSQFLIPSPSANVCEGGMVSFVSKEAVLKLMYGVCSWIVENQVEHCYTTYDTKNILIKRLYTQMLGFSAVEGAIVQFSGFQSRKSGLPVEWQVLEASLEKGLWVLEKLQARDSAFDYEYGKYPGLADWKGSRDLHLNKFPITKFRW